MKLNIKKFKTIENKTIEIPAQILGGNGLGKSTILEAFSFCLTGKNLEGKEFEQVYDNRIDLHDAIAHVSFTDAYGNEFERIVAPTYQTTRAGIEELKIKRSTRCLKNGIEVNDFSDEFSDFLKFGTDYFFNQKEDVQRSIFIDLLKSKMPDYDVKSASLKLKELKKAQKNAVDDVKSKNEQLKAVKDVEVSTIAPDIASLNTEYLKLADVDNSKLVSEINKRNNDLMMNHFNAKTQIQNDISRCKIAIERTGSDIESLNVKLEASKGAKFEPKQLEDTYELQHLISMLHAKLQSLELFETIEHYAKEHFASNPVLVENQLKIKELMSTGFIAVVDDNSSNCPLSGIFCETAKLHSEKAQSIKFDANINQQITALKSHNRQILEKEMQSINSEYNAVKSDLQEAERKLNNIIESNKSINSDNALKSMGFEMEQNENIRLIKTQIDKLSDDLLSTEKLLKDRNEMLLKLLEPTPEKLPESMEISDELKQAHEQFEMLNKQIIGQTAINENNVKLREQYASDIKVLQANLFTIGEEISDLTSKISDYFSNLQGVVKNEFAGDILIDVELLEYVMSRDEWKDCFKITANGKIFPYECNGALQNNLKLQVLSTFQRLQGYKGITLLDNAEANTSTPINTCGTNCILAYATFDTELIIK